MKEITYTSTKIIPTTPEEKAVILSWGKAWSEMGKEEKTHGGVILLFGDWSGYRAEQKRITHISKAKPTDIVGQVGTVEFTDKTTMNVWREELTRKQILERGLKKQHGYTELIGKLIASGEDYYKV